LLIYKIYLRSNNRNEEAGTIQWIAISLLFGAIVIRFLPRIFPAWFGNDPSKQGDEKNGHKE
jgi:hypothetical protein